MAEEQSFYAKKLEIKIKPLHWFGNPVKAENVLGTYSIHKLELNQGLNFKYQVQKNLITICEGDTVEEAKAEAEKHHEDLVMCILNLHDLNPIKACEDFQELKLKVKKLQESMQTPEITWEGNIGTFVLGRFEIIQIGNYFNTTLNSFYSGEGGSVKTIEECKETINKRLKSDFLKLLGLDILDYTYTS